MILRGLEARLMHSLPCSARRSVGFPSKASPATLIIGLRDCLNVEHHLDSSSFALSQFVLLCCDVLLSKKNRFDYMQFEAHSRWAKYVPCFGALQKSLRGPHSHNPSRQQGAAANPSPKVPLTTFEAWHAVYEPCCCSRAFLVSH